MSDADSAARTPPHDLDAEVGVLGSMLLSMEAVHLARERLSPDSFYSLAHRDIFEAILAVADAHNTVDFILLRDELARRDKLDKVGGTAYLVELTEAVPTSANVEHYIEIVRRHALRRQLIRTAEKIGQEVYQAVENSDRIDEIVDLQVA